MRLGLLDLCVIGPGQSARDVLLGTLELAALADRLGYSRYWVAEHHLGTAHASPEVLVPILAGVTERIRIGAAGVLLSFHSPRRVANGFLLAEALFPGRIDLGVARGRPGTPALEQRLACGAAPADAGGYEERLVELLACLHGRDTDRPCPEDVAPPPVWVLGTSGASAALAARHGAAYSHGLFLRGAAGCATVQLYRQAFRGAGAPHCTLAVAGSCGDAAAVQRALAHHQARNPFVRPSVSGSPRHCAEMLAELADSAAIDELVFLELSLDPQQRSDSLGQLAEAVALDRPPGLEVIP